MGTLAVEMSSGRPEHIVLLPKPTYLPLWTGLATAAVVLGLLFKLYALALAMSGVVLVLILVWTRGTGATTDSGPLPIGRGESAPPHWEVERPPSWWAMVFTLAADATLYASRLFGALFLWLVAPNWPPTAIAPLSWSLAPAAGAALLIAAGGSRLALWTLLTVGSPGLGTAAALSGQMAAAALFVLLAMQVSAPTAHAFQAIVFVIFGYAGLHAAIGTVFAGYGLWRWRAGLVSPRRSLDLRLGGLWHDYAAIAGPVAIGAVATLRILAASGPAGP